ncbi:MAG: peptide-methionine (S)-S-oxide reductase, partial [Muribaculaceae bacterium]|nr:peptide-methionine (S)-S-oxide reductase [Muribaculaceae bacterium]
SYEAPIAVEIIPLKNFYRAEKSLQNYLERTPGGHCTISQSVMDYARGNSNRYGTAV